MLNLVRDILGLVAALGHRQVAVVGHDYGSPVAGTCALVRPDVFRAVVLMSAPYGGAPPPALPPPTAAGVARPNGGDVTWLAVPTLDLPCPLLLSHKTSRRGNRSTTTTN